MDLGQVEDRCAARADCEWAVCASSLAGAQTNRRFWTALAADLLYGAVLRHFRANPVAARLDLDYHCSSITHNLRIDRVLDWTQG